MDSEKQTNFKEPKVVEDINPILKRYGFKKKKTSKTLEFKTLEEWEKIQSIWEEKHPIRYQLREIYYKLYRLWNDEISMIPKRIKWFFQRGWRGYSDCDIWGFDYYLAEIISKGCKQLAKEKQGYPSNSTPEEWDIVINKLVNMFDEYPKMLDFEKGYDKITQEEFDKKMDEMFGLLRKYFVNLWD
jgi:hypothetical protein